MDPLTEDTTGVSVTVGLSDIPETSSWGGSMGVTAATRHSPVASALGVTPLHACGPHGRGAQLSGRVWPFLGIKRPPVWPPISSLHKPSLTVHHPNSAALQT